MTIRGALAFAERLPRATEEPDDDWVLSFSLHEPGRVQQGSLPWAERGPVRGFFHGLLFERETLADKTNSRPDCSDAELVLRVYEHGGQGALSRLRGSFVTAIVDRARDLAIVTRDPLGSHPLFYTEAGSCVLFAAAPQPLLNWPGVSRALNRAALADHLSGRWPDPRETFFSAVRRVPSGWRAVVSAGRLRLERYWDPIPDDRPVQWLTAEETARFDEVFDRAVDRCLHNGPTGIFLSGGLDSISVAAVASDRTRHLAHSPLVALSVGFTDPTCDERARQAAVARELGLRQYLVDFNEAVGPRPLLEQALELNKELGAPLLHSYKPAFLALARRARLNGVRTVLTGQGGDEWLTVTPLLSADLLRRGAFLELAQFFGTLRRSYQSPPLAIARNLLWTCGLRPLAGLAFHRLMPEAHKSRRLERLLAGDPIWVTPDPELRAEQRRRAEGMLAAPDPPQGFYVRELRAGIDHTLIAWEAEEEYALGRRIGVRFLHPFWDPDVVEILGRIPPRLLSEGGRTKGLIRQTLARRFPELRLERQRKVQATPFFQSLLLREGLALADAVGDFPALSALGIVDGRATGAFVRARIKQPGPQSIRAWQPLNLEIWAQSHGGREYGYAQ
jgi:asparagine synthetase B (glutamine-hydrolysing)